MTFGHIISLNLVTLLCANALQYQAPEWYNTDNKLGWRNRTSFVRDQWELSQKAEQDPKIRELSEQIYNAESSFDEWLVMHSYLRSGQDLEDKEVEQDIKDYLCSDFFKSLDVRQKSAVVRSLIVDDSSEWAYGSSSSNNDADTLFDYEHSVKKQPARTHDKLVISGLMGEQILSRRKRTKVTKEINALASEIEPDRLARVILVGGAAVTSDIFLSKYRDYNSYLSQPDENGVLYETRIGGSLHGDFYSSRHVRFAEHIIDPLGRKQIFGPQSERFYAPAYHSTEPIILASILGCYANSVGVKKSREIYRRVSSRLETARFSGGGQNFFADFGDEDDDAGQPLLRELIRDGVNIGDTLASIIIIPGNFTTRLNIKAGVKGVDFYVADGEKEDFRFTIPDGEVEDYVVAMATSAFGRTSPQTLIDIVDVLRQY